MDSIEYDLNQICFNSRYFHVLNLLIQLMIKLFDLWFDSLIWFMKIFISNEDAYFISRQILITLIIQEWFCIILDQSLTIQSETIEWITLKMFTCRQNKKCCQDFSQFWAKAPHSWKYISKKMYLTYRKWPLLSL